MPPTPMPAPLPAPADIRCLELSSASPSRRSVVRAARRHPAGPRSPARGDYQPKTARRTIGALGRASGTRPDGPCERSGDLVESADRPPLLPSLRLDELLDELQVR